MRAAGATKSAAMVMAPLLRWAGSKRMHVPFLRQCWSSGEYSRYIEPFAGSAAAFFAIAPQDAVLADINCELIQTYRAICQAPSAVFRRLHQFSTGKDEYYSVRAMRPTHAVTKAARFVYLNRFCFNGLYRTNIDGDFNVPYGAPKTLNLPDLVRFQACARLLRCATLVDADFREVLAKVREGDFVYLDPPYAVSHRRVFIQYAKGHFSTKDLT